jgi:hypothetical protein
MQVENLKKVFVSGNYVKGASGRFGVSVDSCPRASFQRGLCRVKLQGYRFRKCGPSHPIAKFLCETHAFCFSVYPFGWYPYSREPINEELLGAIADASTGNLWPEESKDGSCVRTTQCRRIKRAARIIGLGSDPNTLSQLSQILMIPSVDLNNVFLKIRDGPPRRRSWAGSLSEIIVKLPRSRTRVFLKCGSIFNNRATFY